MTLTPEIHEYIHEIADAVVNPDGYADDADETDARWERRSVLETCLSDAVSAVLMAWSAA